MDHLHRGVRKIAARLADDVEALLVVATVVDALARRRPRKRRAGGSTVGD
jgi:hypothetical protein